MPRLPYVAKNITEPAELIAEFRARSGGDLLDVQRMMLHSPALASAWNGFFGGIRKDMQLPPRLRELIACAVGRLNDAEYQHEQHAAPFLAAGGCAAQLQALISPEQAATDCALFDPIERAILQLCVEMTRSIKVSDASFAQARTVLGSDRLIVEVVGVIAAYNLVSRFLIALHVGQ